LSKVFTPPTRCWPGRAAAGGSRTPSNTSPPHHGIDWLCDCHADIGPDTTMITNPARVAARKRLATAEAELANAQRALAQPGCAATADPSPTQPRDQY